VDVAYIFKNHDLIKKEIESVQSQTDQFQEQFNAKREEMKTAVDQLKSFRAGSPEFAAQEEMIAGLDSQLRLQMTRKRKELADAEAKIYYDNYQLITQSVKAIAEFYKYDLVLRYNSEKMDPAEGATVIRGVMKSVIYQAPNMDMTKGVMEYLTRLKTNVARK
ncbi:MAG: OmpH family outer membrane protein, partial [Planctomycetota bacterium]